MKKIKVLHTITRMVVGGAQENTMLSVDLLDKEKYEVHMYSGLQTGEEGSLFDECKKRNLKIFYGKYLVREFSWKDILHSIEFYQFLKKNKYDIIHTHCAKAGVVHKIIGKLAGVKIIVGTVHGWSFHDRMSNFKKKIYVFLENWAAKYAEKMITVTDLDIEKGLVENISSRDKYMTIHSSIEIERYRNPIRSKAEICEEFGFSEDDFVIGTVARLSPQKAPIDFMIMAKEIHEKYPKIKFLYVGDGPLKEDVEQYIKENGLNSVVVLAGLRRDVPDLLSIMDIFVLSSLWEGLPRVFSQAMSAKLPIVATRVAGAPEAIVEGKNGYTTTPGKPSELAKKLQFLIENENIREEFGDFGYKFAEQHFSVKSMITDIDDLYQKLLKKS